MSEHDFKGAPPTYGALVPGITQTTLQAVVSQRSLRQVDDAPDDSLHREHGVEAGPAQQGSRDAPPTYEAVVTGFSQTTLQAVGSRSQTTDVQFEDAPVGDSRHREHDLEAGPAQQDVREAISCPSSWKNTGRRNRFVFLTAVCILAMTALIIGLSVHFGTRTDGSGTTVSGSNRASAVNIALREGAPPSELLCMLPERNVVQDCRRIGWPHGRYETTYRARIVDSSKPLLHIIAMDSSQPTKLLDDGSYTPGRAFVEFRLLGSNVLVLSARERTNWTVSVTERRSLRKVIAVGYHPQTLQFSADTQDSENIEVLYYDITERRSKVEPCGFSFRSGFSYRAGFCDTYKLITDMENITGLTLASYDGCAGWAELFTLEQKNLCGVQPWQAKAKLPFVHFAHACQRLPINKTAHDCRGGLDFYQSSTMNANGTALHFIGIQATSPWASFDDNRPGRALVNFELPGPNVLVLSAYRPTTWTVRVKQGGSLLRVVVIGYYKQKVKVLGNKHIVQQHLISYSPGSQFTNTCRAECCGFEYHVEAHRTDLCNAQLLIERMERSTGLKRSSFTGCNFASKFTLKPACPSQTIA